MTRNTPLSSFKTPKPVAVHGRGVAAENFTTRRLGDVYDCRVWRGVSASCKLLAGVCSRNSPKKKDRGGCVSSQRKLSNEIHQKKHKHGDRNHSSNATGDISVTTQSEERKQCSFNAYLYNQPTGSATYVRQTELSLTA
ncbi:hypothetical protein HID58_049229 [Brassica napus]|uniref:Uncharacterized protein n=1 Tax=Brassica napus TaxID=3708 RepID=A0ABQ8B5W0_BRANA|nr:hypothetical protein HID58_049229 [Brassica napus]